MYATHPERSWPTRFQYLCDKHGVGGRGVPWNSFWKVIVDAVVHTELVWPYSATYWHLYVEGDPHIDSAAATALRLLCRCSRFHRNGNFTDTVESGIVWFVPYIGALGPNTIDLSANSQIVNQNDALVWIRHLKSSTVLRTLASSPPGKRLVLPSCVTPRLEDLTAV